VPAQLMGKPITLTGILPQSDFRTKNAWQTAALFEPKKHVGCKKASCAPKPESLLPQALATERSIENLLEDQVVLGADVAASFQIRANDSIALLGSRFEVLAVLPATGTVDDGRV